MNLKVKYQMQYWEVKTERVGRVAMQEYDTLDMT